MTLLEISEDLLSLEAQLEDLAGDVTESGALVDAWLSACNLEAEKLDHYAALVVELEARAEARKAEADRLAARAKVDASRATFLKECLRLHFIRHGKKTIETRRYRITHAANGGRLPIFVDVSPDLLPETFRKAAIKYSPDYDAITAALDAGQEVLDAAGRVVARYGERGSSIRIK